MNHDDILEHSIKDHMRDPDWWNIYQNIEPYLNKEADTKADALANINSLIEELEEAAEKIKAA